MGKTLFDKIWDGHVIKKLPGGDDLLFIDRHFIVDLNSNIAFDHLAAAGRGVREPLLTFALQDHTLATMPERHDDSFPAGAPYVKALRANAYTHGLRLFDLGDRRQGIVHVVGPETGILLPGCTSVAGDSHTSTGGGIGALGFGIGTSEVEHVLTTQTLPLRKPKTMRINFRGHPPSDVYAKDLILHLIGKIGAGSGIGFAVEYDGPAIREMPVEARLTICNMSIEFGARVGMIAPDDNTFSYLSGREFAPKGLIWDRAVAYWRTLKSEPDAKFEREVDVDIAELSPQVTWGTSPQDVIGIDECIPDPAQCINTGRRSEMARAMAYMGIQPGRPLLGTPIDWAFIGSCTNSRLSDLEVAASIVQGRRVASNVRALIVPGSSGVKQQAEERGLDQVFKEAGFEWHESACSLCASANADKVGAQERCISTSNRNFEGRQGAGARTHLASPATVAASAIAGHITDARSMVN